MTVEYIGRTQDGREAARCQWFVNGELKEGTFPIESLEVNG